MTSAPSTGVNARTSGRSNPKTVSSTGTRLACPSALKAVTSPSYVPGGVPLGTRTVTHATFWVPVGTSCGRQGRSGSGNLPAWPVYG